MLSKLYQFKQAWDGPNKLFELSRWQFETNMSSYADVTVGVRFSNVSALFCKKSEYDGVTNMGVGCDNLCNTKLKFLDNLKWVPVLAVAVGFVSRRDGK